MNRLPRTTTCKIAVSARGKLVYIKKAATARDLSSIFLLSLRGSALGERALPSLPMAVSGVTNTLMKRSLCVINKGMGNVPSSTVCVLSLSSLSKK